jgi:hypothetical protein
MVTRYLTAYLQAAEIHLQDHADMVIDWLRRVLDMEPSPVAIYTRR